MADGGDSVQERADAMAKAGVSPSVCEVVIAEEVREKAIGMYN